MKATENSQINYRLADDSVIEYDISTDMIYESSYQNYLFDEVQRAKAENNYDIDDLLVIHDPFKTNKLSLYPNYS